MDNSSQVEGGLENFRRLGHFWSNKF